MAEGYGSTGHGWPWMEQWNDSRAGKRSQEYRQLIHDLSKKLSHENVQSISFLKQSSTDCCAGHCRSAACAVISQPAAQPAANHGLQVLENLWHIGEFSETNLDPLVKLLRDIGRHDLADECREKSAKLYLDLHRPRYRRGECLNQAVSQNFMAPAPVPPTLHPSPGDLDYRDSTESNDTTDTIPGRL